MKRISYLVNKATASRYRPLGCMIFVLLFVSFFALSPYSAYAQCAQWNVVGQWEIQQGGDVVYFDLTQKGNLVTGRAQYFVERRGTTILGIGHTGAEPAIHNGDVDGTIKSDNYVIHVYWDNHVIGVYTGKISPTGKMEGKTYDEANPSVKIPWYSKKSFVCPAPTKAAVPAPATVQKTIKATGHPRVDPPPPPVKTIKMTGHPRVEAPQISATPNNLAVFPAKIGHTLIKWDGGSDHANAELWVKVDNLDEKLVIAQGKGSRQMSVDTGKTYIYILKDAGKQLASVRVKFH